MKDYLLDKLIDLVDESFEAHRQLGIAVQNLQDAIFKELHLEQICEWLEKILQQLHNVGGEKWKLKVGII